MIASSIGGTVLGLAILVALCYLTFRSVRSIYLSRTPAGRAKREAAKGRSHRRGWVVGLLLLLIVGIANASSGSIKSGPPVTGAPAKPAPRPNAPAQPATDAKAVAYIDKLKQDTGVVQASVEVVQISLGQAIHSSSSQGDIDQVAQQAQQAHDQIDGLRDDFAQTNETNGELGNAETEVFTAANDLKNAMGALVAYTGSPNPATLAHFTTQYQNARSEWNHGVRAIWRAANQHHAPAI